MQTPKRLLVAFVVIAGSLAAQTPTITGIVNGASEIPPGFPNYAIAEGSIFVVYGTNLGSPPPAGAAVNAAPLPLPVGNFAGTSVTVAVGGTTLPVPIQYTSPGQLAGIMPSATPAGAGTLTVTYAGQSVSSPVKVLVSAFGISNLRVPSGHETAAVAFGTNENEVVSALDAAAPGDVLSTARDRSGSVHRRHRHQLPYSGQSRDRTNRLCGRSTVAERVLLRENADLPGAG